MLQELDSSATDAKFTGLLLKSPSIKFLHIEYLYNTLNIFIYIDPILNELELRRF